MSALVQYEAAKHTGVDPSAVSIVRIEAKEWPDAGLGCGKPGEVYAQGRISGWLVEVKAANKTLEYHTDQIANKIVLCKESG